MGPLLPFVLGLCAALTSASSCCPSPNVALDFTANTTVPGQTCSPVGNGAETRTSLLLQGTTAANDTREFLATIGLRSTMGSTAPSTPYRDKVALYVGVEAHVGTGDTWAINPLLTQEPGSGEYDAQGIELDLNNNNAHRGDADAGAGLAPPVTYGLSVTGASKYRSTSAILVVGAKQTWNRGITFANDAVVQSTFQDLSSPQKSVDIRGSPVYGVYQSSPDSKNYFNGGTGFGVEHPEVPLDVAGTIQARGDVRVHVGHTAHTAALAHGQHPVTVSGLVKLGAGGGARVTLPPTFLTSTEVGGARFTLTAIGAAMPNLHVAAAMAAGDDGFDVRGGVPHAQVSWAVTADRTDAFV